MLHGTRSTTSRRPRRIYKTSRSPDHTTRSKQSSCKQCTSSVLSAIPAGGLLRTLSVKTAISIASFEHTTSPSTGDPNKTRTVRLISEHNPAVAVKLPGPVWSIIAQEVATEVLGRPEIMTRGYVSVRDVRVHGTFEDKGAATETARGLDQELAGRIPGGRVVNRATGDGSPFLAGITAEVGGRRQTVRTVQVNFDVGTLS